MRKLIRSYYQDLGRMYCILMLILFLLAYFTIPVYAVDDMWTVANRVIKDVYSLAYIVPHFSGLATLDV